MPGPVRIFGPVISTYGRVIQIVCEEAGLKHETVPTAARSRSNRHPFGKVPVVEIDGHALYETVSVAAYIDNAHGGGALQPEDPLARAVMDRWISIANAYLFPLFENGLVMPYVMHRHAGFPLDRSAIKKASLTIERALTFIDDGLNRDGAWSALGFTLADAFLYPIVQPVVSTTEGAGMVSHLGRLQGWLRAAALRPSIAATRWETEA